MKADLIIYHIVISHFCFIICELPFDVFLLSIGDVHIVLNVKWAVSASRVKKKTEVEVRKIIFISKKGQQARDRGQSSVPTPQISA